MVLAVIQCYGVSLCYGVNLCYGVSPCCDVSPFYGVSLCYVTQPERGKGASQRTFLVKHKMFKQ